MAIKIHTENIDGDVIENIDDLEPSEYETWEHPTDNLDAALLHIEDEVKKSAANDDDSLFNLRKLKNIREELQNRHDEENRKRITIHSNSSPTKLTTVRQFIWIELSGGVVSRIMTNIDNETRQRCQITDQKIIIIDHDDLKDVHAREELTSDGAELTNEDHDAIMEEEEFNRLEADGQLVRWADNS